MVGGIPLAYSTVWASANPDQEPFFDGLVVVPVQACLGSRYACLNFLIAIIYQVLAVLADMPSRPCYSRPSVVNHIP